MRSSRKTIYMSVAVGLGLASVQAAYATAPTYIDGENSSPTIVKYAQEISVENTALFQAEGSADYSIKVNSGMGASAGSTSVFYRLDLTNATFSSALPSLNVGSSGTVALTGSTPGSAGSSGIATLVGGGSSASSGVWNVTANVSGFQPTTQVYISFSSGGNGATSGAPLKIVSKAPVKLKFRAFASLGEANSATNALYTKEVTIIDFAPSFVFAPGSKVTTNIDATNSFGQFTTGSTGPSSNQVALLGSFSLSAAGNTYLAAAGSAVSGLDQVSVSGSNALILSGNFSTMQSLPSSASSATSATGIFIGTTTGCATAATGYSVTPVFTSGASGTPTSVKITGIPATGTGAVYVCYNDTSGTGQSILESDYTLQFVPSALNSSFVAISYDTATIGNFKRSGTELQASFVAGTSVATQVNRFIFTNTGSSPASIISARVLNGDNVGTSGAITTPTGTLLTIPSSASVIPAYGNLAIEVPTIMPSTITKRSSVIFTIGAPNATVKGTYQLMLLGSNVQAVAQMVGPSQSQ